MRTILLALILNCFPVNAAMTDSLAVMFWNLENFFDTEDEGKNHGEKEFSATGTRRWTKGRFFDKCNAIAKSILWTGGTYGRMPDAIGLAEVENSKVLYTLLGTTALKKHGYKVIHYDSDDPRGIDVAMLYNGKTFEKVSSKAYKVLGNDGKPIKTRDILLVCLKDRRNGKSWHYIVNHHPSKFSGSKASSHSRDCAMNTLVSICDSLMATGEENIVAMGDFNDTPESRTFDLMGSDMKNLALPFAEKGEGTIRYQGKWDMIDMFIVSEKVGMHSEMGIVRIPFLIQRDNAHTGEKPLRTYSGPRYIGGVSDHFPVIIMSK